jgi:alkylated DNA repair dioxygenase AlkB
LAAFADGVASVSLGAAVVMDFAHVADGRTASLLLRPGDLLTMHGEARYDWTHGCAHRGKPSFASADACAHGSICSDACCRECCAACVAQGRP